MTSQDIELIHIVRKVLKATNSIGITRNKRSEAYRVQIGNVRLYNWFVSIGLHPNKSRTLGKIDVPEKYFIDFLRGHLDGDGTITSYSDYSNVSKNKDYIYKRLTVRFLSGSKDHAEWLYEKIVKTTGVIGRLHKVIPNKNYAPMYVIKFGKKDSLHLLPQLYHSKKAPCLKRKRDIFEAFIIN